MARAIAFPVNLARTVRTDPTALLRAMVVTSCGIALVLAGQPLPF